MGKIVLSYEFNDDGTVKSVTTKGNKKGKKASKKMQKEALREAKSQLEAIFGDRVNNLRFK